MKPTINTPAPDFSVPDQHNRVHTLNEYKGKWLLLYFYPKDFTSGCTTEACQLRDHFGELKSRVEIVGVSTDSVKSHAKFAEAYNLPFVILSDPENKLVDAYGTNGLIFTKRTSFLIDPSGVIKKIYQKVKPDKHAQEVLDDLREFTAGK
jgi:thioredoxin-dependent peroxiredoxin